jgi:hypothetical protein
MKVIAFIIEYLFTGKVIRHPGITLIRQRPPPAAPQEEQH